MSKKKFFIGQEIDTRLLDASSVIYNDVSVKGANLGIRKIIGVYRDSQNHILQLDNKSTLTIKIK